MRPDPCQGRFAWRCKGRFAWSFHNLVAHPLAEVLYLLGAERLSTWVHDATIPEVTE